MNTIDSKTIDKLVFFAEEKLALLQILAKNISSLCDTMSQDDVKNIELHIGKQQEYTEMINRIDEKYKQLIAPFSQDQWFRFLSPLEGSNTETCPPQCVKLVFLLQNQQKTLKRILDLNTLVISKANIIKNTYKHKINHTHLQRNMISKFHGYVQHPTGINFDYKEKKE